MNEFCCKYGFCDEHCPQEGRMREVTKKDMIEALDRVINSMTTDWSVDWCDKSILLYIKGYYGIMEVEEE
jgi:hypothetical protein